LPSLRQAFASLILGLTAAAAAAMEPEAPPMAGTAEAARAAALQELDAMRAILLDGHPGAIDAQNPGYRAKIESGYQAALARVKDVQNQHDAMSVADAYAVGFRDGHLVRHNNVNTGDTTVSNGWVVARAEGGDGRIRVAHVASDWPVVLPPVGAEMVACDGRSPQRIVAEDVDPFVPELFGIRRESMVLAKLSNPAMQSLQLKSCTFRLSDGTTTAFPQHYQHMEFAAARALLAGVVVMKPASRINDMQSLPDGTLWVRVGNFMPNAKDAQQIEALLEQLKTAPPARRIVFDTRSNGGGDSRIGERIFEAATGGLDYDRAGLEALPQKQAWWRASPTTILALDWLAADVRRRLGEDDPTLRRVLERQESLRAALGRGEAWVLQEGGVPRLTPEELVRRHAHLQRFAGSVVLLTDSDCGSACLDFADLVRQVPGSLHVGETTYFDSVYIDVGAVKLPSGNSMWLPLKVWRNRLRGNDEPWVPQVPIAVTERDDAQVRAAVLAAAEKAGR